MSTIRLAAAVALLPITLASAQAQTRASVTPSYTLASPGYTQNFDTLANSGSPSQVLPAGFQIVESGTGGAVDGAYAVGTGSDNAGNAYSFGDAGSTDRALGSLTSGPVSPIMFGGVFTNGLGSAITSLAIGYTGEQWRRGSATTDGLTFSYSLNATDLTNGTWTTVAALNFAPLFTSGSGSDSALNGNLPADQRVISGVISGLAIATDSKFGLRWTDLDVTGTDQGLAVDNLSITATTAAVLVAAAPEPATWLTMILGFGLIGAVLRRRRPSAGLA